MAAIADDLRRALEADDAGDLERIVREKKQQHFETLMSLLSTDPSVNPLHRTRAIFALGKWGDARAINPIKRILPELDEMGRATGVDALGRLGTPEALSAILDRAGDPSPTVRKFVARALGKMNVPESLATLSDMERKDPETFVREVAAKSRRRLEERR
jgi:HEAT repeat protein